MHYKSNQLTHIYIIRVTLAFQWVGALNRKFPISINPSHNTTLTRKMPDCNVLYLVPGQSRLWRLELNVFKLGKSKSDSLIGTVITYLVVVRSEIFTVAGLLHPLLLPRIYPPLFHLYALYNEKDDDAYWKKVLQWNKQADLALMAYLGVQQ